MSEKWQKFKESLERAFKVSDGKDELVPEDYALLDKVVEFLVKRKMVLPAIMFLETVHPLNFIASSTMTFFGPILAPLLKKFEYDKLENLLQKRCTIQVLIEKLNAVSKNAPTGQGKA